MPRTNLQGLDGRGGYVVHLIDSLTVGQFVRLAARRLIAHPGGCSSRMPLWSGRRGGQP